jgi:hypothetical protein
LLVERLGVNILLIGGPDEVEIAKSVLNSVLHPRSVGSVAGQTSLGDLPGLLLNCALYIGNDSGPKHIAAAAGVPTIGIHSGVVDPVEWGPLGPRAVALRRNMSCSPCYLAKAEDCPRALACLRYLEPNLVFEAAKMLLSRPDAVAPLPALETSRAASAAPVGLATPVSAASPPQANTTANGRANAQPKGSAPRPIAKGDRRAARRHTAALPV